MSEISDAVADLTAIKADAAATKVAVGQVREDVEGLMQANADLIATLEAGALTPEVKALIADVKASVADVKSSLGAVNDLVPNPAAPPAP